MSVQLQSERSVVVEAGTSFGRTNSWSYDPLYRLTNEIFLTASGSNALGYVYDAVGNRTTRSGAVGSLGGQSPSYNANDWLNTDAYDNNGNTLWSTNGSTLGPYCYDAENRLTNYNNSVYLVYNGDGVRVQKTVSGTKTYYLIDDRNPSGYAQVLEEWQDTGGGASLSKVYAYGLELISQKQGSITYYLGYDGHGSTRYLLNTSGGLVETYAYDAFGNLIAGPTTPSTAYLYCGEQSDPDLGFYYLRARYLNPNTGRFWTMDTYAGNNEDPLSLHKYLYCQGNPVDNTDPSGENYYFGGSRHGTGHFWVAVDIGNGKVLKYDYGRKGYKTPKGSWGTVKGYWYGKSGPGQADIKENNSIEEAAGPDEHYSFFESSAEDLAMEQRMIDSTNHLPDYNFITHNCGHQSFEIAQHGWPGLDPVNPLPARFLDVVQLQWKLRKTYSVAMSRGIGFLDNIFDMVTMFLPIP